MKKIYVTPQLQVFELAAKTTILSGIASGTGSYDSSADSGMDEDEDQVKEENFWGKGW